MGARGAGDEPVRGPTRRRFLIGLGVGVIGVTSVGAMLFENDSPPGNTTLGAQWLFGRAVPGCTDADFDDSAMTTVDVPHCVTNLSWQGWEPTHWEQVWVSVAPGNLPNTHLNPRPREVSRHDHLPAGPGQPRGPVPPLRPARRTFTTRTASVTTGLQAARQV